ncbi:MAG: hypothetical protein ACJ73Y_11730 [Rubrobacteraceae bacterium]
MAFQEEWYGSEVHVQPVFGHDDAERLLVGGPGWLGGRSGAISAKYRSKPAGEMISSSDGGTLRSIALA